MPNLSKKPVTTLQKRVVRIMTFSDPRSHSEPLLKSLRLPKFFDIVHLEILSFVYQWYHELRSACFANISTQYLQFILIIHVNHRLIICLLNLFIPRNTAFVFSVTLVLNFGILYLLMEIKSFSSFRQHIKNLYYYY